MPLLCPVRNSFSLARFPMSEKSDNSVSPFYPFSFPLSPAAQLIVMAFDSCDTLRQCESGGERAKERACQHIRSRVCVCECGAGIGVWLHVLLVTTSCFIQHYLCFIQHYLHVMSLSGNLLRFTYSHAHTFFFSSFFLTLLCGLYFRGSG